MRKIKIHMTQFIQESVFEQYSSWLDRLSPRASICSEITISHREIFSFFQNKIFATPQFFLDALIRQPKVKIEPGSLYMGESRWNELFQNVYDQFGILNRCKVLELPQKVGKFLTRSVRNVLLTRD